MARWFDCVMILTMTIMTVVSGASSPPGLVVNSRLQAELLTKTYATSASSNLVQVYYDHAKAGSALDRDKKSIPSTPPKEIASFLETANLSWSKLPELLQAALLWDFGYVFGGAGAYTKIYTSCKASQRTMEAIAVSIEAFVGLNGTDFDAQDCGASIRQHNLQGSALYPVVKCAAEDVTTEMHSSMWVAVDVESKKAPLPYPQMGRHAWNVEPKWLILAIHTAGEDVEWSKCPADKDSVGLVIPCVKYDDDKATWCRPERSAVLEQWLQEVQANGTKDNPINNSSSSGTITESDGSSGSTTIYIVIGIVVLLFVLAAFFVWKRNQNKALGSDHDDSVHQERNRQLHHQDLAAAAYRHQQLQQQQHRQPGPSLSAEYEHYDSPIARPPTKHRLQSSAVSKTSISTADQSVAASTDFAKRPQSTTSSSFDAAIRPPQGSSSISQLSDEGATPVAGKPQVNRKGKKSTNSSSKSNEVAARVLAEFQADPALGHQRIPYSALYFTRVLSKGAFGEVWLAQLENRQVAVKRILNEKKHDEKEIECFAAEIKLMASFYHPKIVEFVGVSWSTLQDLCAITEYMVKGDLYGFLKRKQGQLNWRDHKIYLAEDVADALSYLHSLQPKVIHRDLKSKNILLDDSFRAKLSDFGISRERTLEETMTAGVGTIYWTAPEVLMGKKYTEKADIYSFGIVMSELDTHQVPYYDKCDASGKKLQGMKIIQKVIRQQMRPTFTPQCPADVKALADRCLNADPDVRPDAPELLQLILQLQRTL